MRLFFSVGEPSGDQHGAHLIGELRRACPGLELRGMGGPLMEAAGMTLIQDLTQLAVMWITQVVRRLPDFYRALGRVDAELRRWRPDAVVLIDFPGFNWWVARRARRYGIPVIYYGVPQLWAWGRWRVRKMRRLVDLVLCKLAFEAKWYRARGIDARFVGHPYFDELAAKSLDEDTMRAMREGSGPLLALLPGSRRQEVELNLPPLLRAAERVAGAVPDVRVVIGSYNTAQADQAERILEAGGAARRVPVEIVTGRTTELIASATAAMACSGSVSLELLYYAVPAVIHYRVSRATWFFARRFLLTVRYITLANLIACDDRFDTARGPYGHHPDDGARVPFPEYPCHWDASESLAQHVIEWLADPALRAARQERLAAIRDQVVTQDATARAAHVMLDALGARLRKERAA